MSLTDLVASLEVRVSAFARRAAGIDHPIDRLERVIGRALSPGNSGPNRVNQLWQRTRSLTASGNETLSLDGNGTGGALLLQSALGETIAFNSILVFAVHVGNSQLTFGNAAVDPWAPMFPLLSSDRWVTPTFSNHLRYNPNGWPVGAGSRNLLVSHVQPSVTTYELVLVGRAP